MTALLIIIAIIALLAMLVIGIYNNLVSARQKVKNSETLHVY